MRLKDLNLNYCAIGFVLKKKKIQIIIYYYCIIIVKKAVVIETDGVNYTMNEIQVWDFNLDEYLFL